MIDVISTEDLAALVSSAEAPCVSITMPTHRIGRETTQDPIRFKNLLSQAERRLIERGLRSVEASALLAPARALLDDARFWTHQEDGLVAYVHPGGLRTFRLPIRLNAHVDVAHEPDTAPLQTFRDERNEVYWVAAISQHDVRLIRATRFTASEIDLSGPHSVENANWFVRREPETRPHTGGRLADGQLATPFRGHSGTERDEVEDLLRFLRGIDAAIRSAIGDSECPVVLAGVGTTLADFRRVSKLRHLQADQLEGNPEHLSVEELRQRTLPLVSDALGAS